MDDPQAENRRLDEEIVDAERAAHLAAMADAARLVPVAARGRARLRVDAPQKLRVERRVLDCWTTRRCAYSPLPTQG